MTNDDYEDLPRLGEILQGILARLACNLAEGENVGDNVISIEQWRRDHPRLTNNSAIANHASASAAMPSK